MSGFSATLETANFNRELDRYMKFQKRDMADVINTKLYYIARNATMTTQASNKGKIDEELRGPARDYPKVPLAAILVNLKRGQGQGLEGSEMKFAMESLIRKRKASINYIRSGWKAAIVILERYLRSTDTLAGRKPPVDRATMVKQDVYNLGSAKPAIGSGGSSRVAGEIENKVGSKARISELENIKTDGLQQAIDRETKSMDDYIEKKLSKLNEETSRKL